jgi:TfoX/Sxy family transcriptional regulator of competence genes
MSIPDRLAQRIRAELGSLPNLVEKKMFGGIGFILQGSMACGVHRENLIVRVGPDRYEEALKQPHTNPFDLTGRPMAGWITVKPQGYEADEDLKRWIWQGVEFALSLPAK